MTMYDLPLEGDIIFAAAHTQWIKELASTIVSRYKEEAVPTFDLEYVATYKEGNRKREKRFSDVLEFNVWYADAQDDSLNGADLRELSHHISLVPAKKG